MLNITRRGTAIALLACLSLPTAFAQAYPSKPISLIVPFPPGGATDVQARALAHAASLELKQPIVILNQPGAAATLGPATMARQAAPDGYMIALMASTLYRLPYLQKVNFDPLTDFTYITNVTAAPVGVTVRQDAPWKDMKALLAHAKAKPGEVSYGTIGKGSTSHVAMERLAAAAGVKFNFVPFKGASEVYNALQGGHLDVAVEAGFGTVVNGGKARLLALFNESRTKGLPNVPTIKELGFDVVMIGSWGIGGPKGMDPKVVQVLQDALIKAIDNPDFTRTLELNDYTKMPMDSKRYTEWAVKTIADEKRFVSDLKIKLDE
jgi:tripartite-type tricarboxylate transporter receptor subunit TctC